jgi:hypothetical protein
MNPKHITFSVITRHRAQDIHREKFLALQEERIVLGKDDRRKVLPSGNGMFNDWMQGGAAGLMYGTSHVIFLDDDTIPCEGFLEVARKAVEAMPDKLLCFYCGHKQMIGLPHGQWMGSHDSMTGVCEVIPNRVLMEARVWLRENILPHQLENQPDDFLLNIYAMCNNKLTYHSVPSLVEHGDPDFSTQGNEKCSGRTASVPPLSGQEMSQITWTNWVTLAGRIYSDNHWFALCILKDPLKYVGRMCQIHCTLETWS